MKANEWDFEVPQFSILDTIRAMQREGETLIETARRCLVNEALYRAKGNQVHASKILGLKSHAVSTWLYHRRQRRKTGKAHPGAKVYAKPNLQLVEKHARAARGDFGRAVELSRVQEGA